MALAPRLGAEGQLDELEAVLDRVDGLVLTGGDDFVTEGLGLGATHPAAEVTEDSKQDYDLALTRLALERDLPILGICYGMQCLGLAGVRRYGRTCRPSAPVRCVTPTAQSTPCIRLQGRNSRE